MANNFKIKELHKHFGDQKIISIDELHQFYKNEEPDLPRSTLRWRVHELINQGVLHSVKRGVYTLEEGKRSWKPKLLPAVKEIHISLQEKYPYTKFCIWSTQWLLDLTHHMPVKNFMLVDTERETEESVFHYLQDTQNDYSVYLKPSRSEIDRYLGSDGNSIVVRSLLSQSPLMDIEGVQIPKLEKIMVDLIADDDLFTAYQGKELQTIFKNISDAYTINRSTLHRYSQRRNKWDKVKSYLEDASNEAIDI